MCKAWGERERGTEKKRSGARKKEGCSAHQESSKQRETLQTLIEERRGKKCNDSCAPLASVSSERELLIDSLSNPQSRAAAAAAEAEAVKVRQEKHPWPQQAFLSGAHQAKIPFSSFCLIPHATMCLTVKSVLSCHHRRRVWRLTTLALKRIASEYVCHRRTQRLRLQSRLRMIREGIGERRRREPTRYSLCVCCSSSSSSSS